ncbi:hypothetical protein F506_18670 [Herbaspirillum hiltneri N3]|uniref:Uncharacterized protein n=1 Tax=Herbaspirillum hiltneri N3 TaxID=1262470 RepID=A0ABN4I2Q6_9BURK|nr:hypothetical protein [Herbaspirillum hiltneri]AKZ64409.1 hypothetical protein F506_18670 [Herbaspirillum hiltneri N3]
MDIFILEYKMKNIKQIACQRVFERLAGTAESGETACRSLFGGIAANAARSEDRWRKGAVLDRKRGEMRSIGASGNANLVPAPDFGAGGDACG